MIEAMTITASVTCTENIGATHALSGESTKRKEQCPILIVCVRTKSLLYKGVTRTTPTNIGWMMSKETFKPRINNCRVVILLSLLVAIMGPWTFDRIHVPAQYTCSTPFVRLEGDFLWHADVGDADFFLDDHRVHQHGCNAGHRRNGVY